MSEPRSLRALNETIIECAKCPRLTLYRARVAREKKRMYRSEEYWGRPVPGWGDPDARVYVVGLAPAAHGGNRTGRVFTSERLPYSGLPCYPYLYQLLIDDLCEAGAIQGRGIGTKGALTVKDLGALTKIVDSSHPKGVVLELPSGEIESNES